MNGKYNIWNKWDPLKTVMLGDCYSAEFFKDIKNDRIRSALTQIADETQEDLSYYESVLKDFGCEVIRPELDRNDSILNYINDNGEVTGAQGVPRSPLQPRDSQLVIGNELFYTNVTDHQSIGEALDNYNTKSIKSITPITEVMFNNMRGDSAPDWPTYDEYINRFLNGEPVSDKPHIVEEFDAITSRYPVNLPIDAPSITVVGKDLYVDATPVEPPSPQIMSMFTDILDKQYGNDFRINSLNIGGHNDACFHTLKPGALLSLQKIQTYSNTFPGWDVCYLPDQSWAKVKGFRDMKLKVDGKWWVPGQESNDEFTHFVETWLNDWVGYVEETVFDVNVLVLDEKHVCVSQQNNEQVNNFLKKHGMEPVYIPWRHRYFWDGGLHCITLDLYREGTQQDYFPERTQRITDKGY